MKNSHALLAAALAATTLFAPSASADPPKAELLIAPWPIAQVEYSPAPVQKNPFPVQRLPMTPNQPAKEVHYYGPSVSSSRVPHIFWPGVKETIEPASGGEASPAISSFVTNLYAPDAQIAVSHHFVVANNTGWMTFYDKLGNQLPTKNSLPTSLSMNTFFAGFLNGKNPDGSTNTQNINTVINLPVTKNYPKCTWTQDQQPQPASGPQESCVQQVYDARVQYDATRNRFWVESAARPLIWQGGPKVDDPQLVHRYILVAVSKTEDPRDGWHQYVLVDDYSDWPRMTINGKHLVIGHQGDKNEFVFDADKLAAGNPGHGDVLLQYFAASSFPEADVIAHVTHHGNTNGMTYLLGIGNQGKSWTVYGIDGRTGGAAATLKKATFSTNGTAAIWVRNNPIYRNGLLYITGALCVTANCTRESIRVLRVPLNPQPNGDLAISTSPGAGYLDTFFGRSGPGDAPGDEVSYHVPSLEVTKNGDMVIAYTRVGVKTQKPLWPEVRYSVITHKGDIKRSRLIKAAASDVQPSVIDDGGGVDLTGAAVDPADDTTVWSINPFGDNNAYHLLISHLRP